MQKYIKKAINIVYFSIIRCKKSFSAWYKKNNIQQYRYIMKCAIGSTIFNIMFGLSTCVISILVVVLVGISKNVHIGDYIGEIWCKFIMRMLKVFCNINVTAEGVKNIPKNACIVACKHQSALETIAMLLYFRLPVFVLKKELLSMPLFGSALKFMKMIGIDRNSGLSAMKILLRNTEEALSKNRPVIIFPEGTRVKPLQSVKYSSGIAALHNKFPNVMILPVATNSGLAWPKNAWIKYPGTVIFRFLTPITVQMKKEHLLEYLQDTIDSHSNALCIKYNNQ